MTMHLISVEDLSVHFVLKSGFWAHNSLILRAVDDVSVHIARGEVLGLVGESGSGKSTLGRALMGLQRPTSGRILLDGEDIAAAMHGQTKRQRYRRMQMVFQDPFNSLNPRLTVGEALTTSLRFNEPELDVDARNQRAGEMMERMGLPRAYLARYPHEFSGGQRQRIGIARALMVNPDFIMADEAVSALDVSVQAQVLNLLATIRQEMNLTMLFVTHDLGVVGHMADRVAVMYLGRIVEIAPTRKLFAAPAHPYTEALLSAALEPDRSARKQRIILQNETPSPINPPTGCHFRTRCRYVLPQCADERPALRSLGEGHAVACIRNDLSLASVVPNHTAQFN